MTSFERKQKRYERRKLKRQQNKNKYNIGYNDVYNFANMYLNGKKCCSGVRWKTSTINFETKLLTNVEMLMNKIINPENYKYEGFTFFQTVEHGKMRDIHSLNIRDRTIQRCYCDGIMTNNYSHSYIKDNSASLKGKGYAFALNRMVKHLRKHYSKYGINGGILQFDFKSYFASIPHKEVKYRLNKIIQNKELVKMGENFIDEFKEMKNHKESEKGVGLGSPISQNIALDYASPLDHYMKDILGIKGYGRYMDDGYIIHDSLDKLKEIKNILFDLAKQLKININPSKVKIIPFKNHGFSFLKIRFILLPSGKIIRKLNRKSIKAIRRKLKLFKKWSEERNFNIEDICTSYQSWRGYAKQFNCYKTLVAMDRLFVNLFKRELAKRSNKFKCTLKSIWNEEIGWIYYSSKKELKEILDYLDKTRYNRYINGFVPLCNQYEWRMNNKSKLAKTFYNFRNILYDKGENNEVYC